MVGISSIVATALNDYSDWPILNLALASGHAPTVVIAAGGCWLEDNCSALNLGP